MAVESKSDDSLPIIRANFSTRRVDTIARLKASDYARTLVIKRPGGIDLQPMLNPLPTFDEWAVLSDGSIAIVRGQDYRVEILRDDGRTMKSPKLPFAWRKVSETEKLAMIDSLRRVRDLKNASIRVERAAPSAIPDKPLAGIIRNDAPPAPDLRPVIGKDQGYVLPSEMVDYYPPIREGAAQPDRDANVWILPTTSSQSVGGELVYDVVNNNAELFKRVRVPIGRSIAGFGKNGVVYLMGKDSNGWFIERTSGTR